MFGLVEEGLRGQEYVEVWVDEARAQMKDPMHTYKQDDTEVLPASLDAIEDMLKLAESIRAGISPGYPRLDSFTRMIIADLIHDTLSWSLGATEPQDQTD